MDKNQDGINSFFKDIHIWGKLSILCSKLMCHYFSASAAIWDIFDSKMTCVSGSTLRKILITTTKFSPFDEKTGGSSL